jgi:hypothetical protein
LNNLLFTGLALYILNYITGWLIYLKKISISKRAHQILFALIIFNLALILVFIKLPFTEFIFCALSICCMAALPFGKKGGIFHRVISSTGLIIYVIFLFLFFKL